MKRCSTSLAFRKWKSKPQLDITRHQQQWLYFKERGGGGGGSKISIGKDMKK